VRPRELARHAGEAFAVARDLLRGRYPDFVTGGPLPRGDIPVFVFHSLEPDSFARRIRHLAENGYSSLGADEYLEVLLGTRPVPEKAVLLTFDDGRGSLWTVGAPLLRRYGLRGVVFLVPGRMRSESGPEGPTWEDVEAGRATAANLAARESGDGAFLSWTEVEALSATGVFEFQSHTFCHARIHVAPVIAGFVTPLSRRGYAAMDLPLIREGERELMGEEVPLGTPLLRSAPRASEELRFFEEPSMRQPWVEAVAAGGGERFFDARDWEASLRRLSVGRKIFGRRETPEEREIALRRELGDARRLIEERTGRAVTHLCYPWHVQGPAARRIARECGYRSAFVGKVAGVPITRAGGDTMAIARIGEDYVELLPGRGRTTLATVLQKKWTRRLAAGRFGPGGNIPPKP
jgi:peptidoglycan/xylan/chitin deacetylase (PgdA/CDA1 family)